MKLSLPVLEEAKSPNGVLLYDGPSQINGKPIVAIATGLIGRGSKNIKTGKMVQCYIIPKDQDPVTSVFKSGDDESVCGDCIHRYKDGGAGSCYVNVAQGPIAIYRAYKRGIYPLAGKGVVSDRLVRLGAYGDPSAVPIQVWDDLLVNASGWTGYTHQWKKVFAQPLKKYCMASCESIAQARRARKMGWRTFRIRRDEQDSLLPNEFECPAGAEQGKRLTCEECLACSGGAASKASPAIIVHGPIWKTVRLKQVMDRMSQKKKFRGIFDAKS